MAKKTNIVGGLAVAGLATGIVRAFLNTEQGKELKKQLQSSAKDAKGEIAKSLKKAEPHLRAVLEELGAELEQSWGTGVKKAKKEVKQVKKKTAKKVAAVKKKK
jgi:hypothetical protein